MYPEVRTQAMVFSHVTLAELDEIALKLLDQMGPLRVCVLRGELGAGKTTFAKALGNVLRVEDKMSSPTFSIVNEYHTASGNKVYHFDFYRMKSEAEAFDIGVEEYFYSGEYCVVEWPENIPSLLPDAYAEVSIQIDDLTHRTIEISFHGRKEEKRI
jgi:tRNA threonylcarbamoyladenosine biosynthesis protein TsaE